MNFLPWNLYVLCIEDVLFWLTPLPSLVHFCLTPLCEDVLYEWPLAEIIIPHKNFREKNHDTRETFGCFGYQKDAAAPAGAHKTVRNRGSTRSYKTQNDKSPTSAKAQGTISDSDSVRYSDPTISQLSLIQLDASTKCPIRSRPCCKSEQRSRPDLAGTSVPGRSRAH